MAKIAALQTKKNLQLVNRLLGSATNTLFKEFYQPLDSECRDNRTEEEKLERALQNSVNYRLGAAAAFYRHHGTGGEMQRTETNDDLFDTYFELRNKCRETTRDIVKRMQLTAEQRDGLKTYVYEMAEPLYLAFTPIVKSFDAAPESVYDEVNRIVEDLTAVECLETA